MKLLTLLGGALGFVIGCLCSRMQANAWSTTLWHACMAAYVGGWLMGWWGRIWQKSLVSAAQEQEARAALATAASSKPSKP